MYNANLIFVWVGGGWGKVKIKDHLSPPEAERWAELGKNSKDEILCKLKRQIEVGRT